MLTLYVLKVTRRKKNNWQARGNLFKSYFLITEPTTVNLRIDELEEIIKTALTQKCITTISALSK